MTPLAVMRLVATREIRERVRSKAFLASTAVSLLIVLAFAILPGVLGDDGPTTYHVAVVGEAGGVRAVLESSPDLNGIDAEVRVRPAPDRNAARRMVASGRVDAAVIDRGEVLVDEELPERLEALLRLVTAEVASRAALAEAGVSPADTERILRPEPLAVTPLDPVDEAADDKEGLVFFGVVLLYGQIIGFGVWVANGVVEEKSSRVVEVVLGKVRPTHLLAGKVIGIGLVAFAQLVTFVAVGLAAASLTGGADLPPGTLGVAAEVLGWFVLGFAFYASLYAVGGALASRAEELQNTTMPLNLVAMGALIGAVTSGANPGGSLARLMTFLPPSAPLVLPLRRAAGEIAAWETSLAVGILLLATVGAVRLAARAYTGGALQFRGQLKLRDALGAARRR